MIDLPLAGEIDLAIVRTQPGSELSMDMLERTVRGAESYMRLPLPVSNVTLLFVDGIHAYGYNALTHMAVGTASDQGDSALGILSHEVTHYYWRGGQIWLHEGAAVFMSRVLLGDRPADWAEPRGLHLRYPTTLSELERRMSEGPDDPYVFNANYNLGSRIFADLYRTLGGESFVEGFGNLYQMLQGGAGGIGEVRDAFKAAAPDSAAAIDRIAARWYDGSEPYDLSYLDTDPVDPLLPAIEGRMDRIYVAVGEDGPPVSRYSTAEHPGDLWLTLEYSYQPRGAPRQLHLEIVEYFEDGFAFHRRGAIADVPADGDGHTFRLPVGMQFLPGTEEQERAELWRELVPHGSYWIFVYHEGKKVAEVEYEITP